MTGMWSFVPFIIGSNGRVCDGVIASSDDPCPAFRSSSSHMTANLGVELGGRVLTTFRRSPRDQAGPAILGEQADGLWAAPFQLLQVSRVLRHPALWCDR
jgi:hypothetical protein